MDFPSKLLEQAVSEFSTLPGIGKKTALRLVLHLLKRDQAQVDSFGNALIRLRSEIGYCGNCHNISDSALCHVCANPLRDKATVCVVEDIRDVMAIENTGQYKGTYHLLGGIISPMDGVGPKDLNIDTLVQKVASGQVKEVIMALSTTMEGDTTNFFIYKKLKEFNIAISTIARGVSVGDELQYADEVTLARSIMNRVPYETSVSGRQ